MNPLEVRSKIKTISGIYHMVHSMETLATMKIMQLRSLSEERKVYAEKIRDMLSMLTQILPPEIPENALLYERARIKNVLLTVITSDRGFCGSMNSDILNLSRSFLKENSRARIITIGVKAGNILMNEGYNVLAIISEKLEGVDLDFSKRLASDIVKGYLNEEFDEVYFAFMDFTNIVTQTPEILKIIPLQESASDKFLSRYPYEHFIFSPEPKVIFKELVRKYVDAFIYRILLDTAASEQAIRMMSMRNASENASNVLESLRKKYQKLRQEKITRELIELSSGVNLLKE
jgi:F-type H+-transporting ATPase subunit gamma